MAGLWPSKHGSSKWKLFAACSVSQTGHKRSFQLPTRTNSGPGGARTLVPESSARCYTVSATGPAKTTTPKTKQPGVLFVTPGCGKLPEARRPMSHAQGIRILFDAQAGTPLIPAGLTIEWQASTKIGAHRLRCEQIRRVGERFRLPLFAV